MTDTKLLYLSDSYQKTLETTVSSVSTEKNLTSITLASTIFYPQGGGQPSDHGTIKGKNGQLKVANVIYNNGDPIHQGKLKGTLEIGESVTCELDWDRRYQNMRVHSAGHLIHEAVHEAYPTLKPIKGEHGIGGKQYIEYEGTTEIDVPKLNVRLAQLVEDDRSIKTEFVSLDELQKRAQFVPENLPANKPLRIVMIDGFEPIPDGGTQVSSTRELEETSITSAQEESGSIRVHYDLPKVETKEKQESIVSAPAQTAISISSPDLTNLKNEALALIGETKDRQELEELRIKFVGRKGEINKLLQSIPSLSREERVSFGRDVNDAKQAIELALSERERQLSFAPVKTDFFDPTVPGIKPDLGTLHPITKIMNEVEDIFRRFGFSVATGPEVEWDEINFQKLRLGPDHPSRDTQETYYFDEKRLLRVHTSSVQIRYMTDHKPPIRIISPGRVYRRDNIDATHLPSFHQIEGILVDDRTTLTDLLGMLEHTTKQLFGPERKVRFYGHNFPYTEPSLEVEVENEKGEWLEIVGCGMVHPEVLENCDIDSKKYQGWAFGMGADRLAMLKYGIDDIRLLYGGDVRFLNP